MDESLCSKAFRYLYEESSLLFLQFDAAGNVTDANRFAVETLGEAVLQRSFRELFVDFKGRLNLAELTRQPGQTHRLDLTTCADGPRTFLFQFFNQDGTTACFAKPDTPGEERMRRGFLELNTELSNLTRQLHKANAQLAELNELKNRFLGMAAHDLRKPVGVVLTYSEFLLDEAAAVLDDEQLQFLTTIHSSTRFMRRLIDDFLDVAMIESGRLSLDLEPTELRVVCDRAVALARVPARKRQIEIVVCPANRPLVARLDASKIEQVLLNLLSNAVEYSDPGASVEIVWRKEVSQVVVGVADKGPGISPEDVGKLFSPYGRGSAKKAAGERSTGLGLAIAKSIVQAHGGRIWVDSTVGAGTTFWFSLPVPK